jgi:DHA2 family multidrug resistance protein
MFSGLESARNRFVEAMPMLRPDNRAYPWLVLVATSIGTFMAVLDATIVNVALTKLTVAFGVSTDQVEWVLTGYLLAFSMMLPASGWLADNLGYKFTFISGVFLFTLGSFLCSLSWSISSLIFFRVIQALGSGIIMPVGMALITFEFPPEKRGVALGFWAIAASASASLGPSIGGFLIENYYWHTIFDVNVPIGILGVMAGVIILREHMIERNLSFDIVGMISMVMFITGLTLGLSDGNASWNADGWASTFILGCFGVSAAGLVIFLATELTVEKPLVDLRLFKDMDFSLGNAVLFIFGFGMFGSIFLLPLYLQSALGYTPLQTGLFFLPMGVLTAVSSPIAGAINDRLGARVPLVIGMLLMAASLYMNSRLTLFSGVDQILVPIFLRGFGMGFIFAPLSAVTISHIPQRKMAQASGLVTILRQIGGSFGIAVFGTILARQVKVHLDALGGGLNLYSPGLQDAAARFSFFALQATGGTMSQAATKAQALLMVRLSRLAFVSAVENVFTIAALVSAAAIIPVLLLRESDRRARSRKPAMSE